MIRLIEPEWPAPPGIRAASTVRHGGCSEGAYASLNLGDHVGDDSARVHENRKRVRSTLSLPCEPVWLRQVHGTRIIDAATPSDRTADGSFSACPGRVCAVMTADCLPILLCARDGRKVAAVHGGWRGLADGILRAAVNTLETSELIAWLGPAIGPDAFEVGAEVMHRFTEHAPELDAAFRPAAGDRWLADLYAIARLQLAALGIVECYGGECCTYSDADQFFSHRRDRTTGRMATLIWRE